MQILSAREFISQGTSAGAIMSIAASQTTASAKAKIEDIAREVAGLTGETLQIPGALTLAREGGKRTASRPVAANDNYRPKARRVAA